MHPIEDLGQFRALADVLPPLHFAASGIVHPRLCLFAATREAGDVTAMTERMVALPFDEAFMASIHAADADFRMYELDLANPTIALGEKIAAMTIAYGMMAIEPGPDLFALASLNEGPVAIDVADPIAALATTCSRDVCALLGAIMAARMAGLPVIVDGDAALAAVQLLHALNPSAVTHCAIPLGSRIESGAQALGLAVARSTDTRPLYALTDAICHTKALTISA